VPPHFFWQALRFFLYVSIFLLRLCDLFGASFVLHKLISVSYDGDSGSFVFFSSARPILQIPAIDLRKDFVQSMALGIFMRWPDNRDWCISPHLYYIRDLNFAHLFLLLDLRLFGRQKPLHIL